MTSRKLNVTISFFYFLQFYKEQQFTEKIMFKMVHIIDKIKVRCTLLVTKRCTTYIQVGMLIFTIKYSVM